MKKIDNKGFTIIELLVVTMFVAGVLIYLFIQFSNLNSSYEESFKYNSIEGLYALEDIKDYIETDESAYENIKNELNSKKYVDIKNCPFFNDKSYCKKLFELQNIENIIFTVTMDDYEILVNEMSSKKYGEDFKTFIKKINNNKNAQYRIIASFSDGTYATVRLGEQNE